MDPEPEVFALRTIGGPFDGQTRMVTADLHPWPLPDEIEMIPDVRYRKVRESNLPPQPVKSVLKRGAEYQYIDMGPVATAPDEEYCYCQIHGTAHALRAVGLEDEIKGQIRIRTPDDPSPRWTAMGDLVPGVPYTYISGDVAVLVDWYRGGRSKELVLATGDEGG
jgi:hypothetical protein